MKEHYHIQIIKEKHAAFTYHKHSPSYTQHIDHRATHTTDTGNASKKSKSLSNNSKESTIFSGSETSTYLKLKQPLESTYVNLITPNYKSGDKTLPLNFRPVSLTALSVRIQERILREIIKHVTNLNKWDLDQHGFKRNHSLLTAILQLVLQMAEDMADQPTAAVGLLALDINKYR